MAQAVSLLTVPYAVGDDRQGASRGADRLLEAGAVGRLAGQGADVAVERVERQAPFVESVSASRAVNEELAAVVGRAAAAERFPLTVAGSCDAALGVLAGLDRADCGVVWIDAHADFNTPETTVSGFFPGMTLAVVTGHCYGALWARIGARHPVPEAAVLVLGLRDLSPDAERKRLERSEIAAVPWDAGEPCGDVGFALERLAARTGEVYLHVDLDGLDPSIAPGIVDAPVPGGLSLSQLEEIVAGVGARFRLRAAAVTTFNPELDEDDRTLTAALRIVEAIATAARA